VFVALIPNDSEGRREGKKDSKDLERPGMVAQAYNPSYLGGGAQKDYGLRPAQAKSSRDPHHNQWLRYTPVIAVT
jgi:hypothetical protein